MSVIAKIADRRIRQAMEEGGFDNLPNAGKPLRLDDDSWIPGDLRMAYRILKNAGCLPPELELKKEIFNLKALISTIDDEAQRIRKIRELNFKTMKLGTILKRPLRLEEYEDRLVEKLVG